MKLKESLKNSRYTFFTAGAVITGVVVDVADNERNSIYALENVTIRSSNLDEILHVEHCEMLSQHIIAITPAIDEPHLGK